VPRPVGARPVQRSKRKAEEVQHTLIGFRWIGTKIVEYDDVAAITADHVEEMADMFAEACHLIIDQLPRFHAGTRNLPARAAILDEPPGSLKVASRFIALIAEALVQRRKQLDRVPDADDELGIRPEAKQGQETLGRVEIGDGAVGEHIDVRVDLREIAAEKLVADGLPQLVLFEAVEIELGEVVRLLDARQLHGRVVAEPARKGRRAAPGRADDADQVLDGPVACRRRFRGRVHRLR